MTNGETRLRELVARKPEIPMWSHSARVWIYKGDVTGTRAERAAQKAARQAAQGGRGGRGGNRRGRGDRPDRRGGRRRAEAAKQSAETPAPQTENAGA